MNAPLSDMITHAGGRSRNEDSCNFLLRPGIGCWALADGLGGFAGGETASQLALETLLKAFARTPELSAQALAQYIDEANQALRQLQKSQPEMARMATTLVVLLCGEHEALWAHVGDSRLYHFRSGRLQSRTRDHSVAQALVEAGDIRTSEIRFHPDRSRLRRSLGQGDQCAATLVESPLSISPEDAFLLCSDGFWEHVLEIEMEAELCKAASPDEWLQGMSRRLRRRVEKDHDNYTAVAVMMAAPQAAADSSGDSAPARREEAP